MLWVKNNIGMIDDTVMSRKYFYETYEFIDI